MEVFQSRVQLRSNLSPLDKSACVSCDEKKHQTGTACHVTFTREFPRCTKGFPCSWKAQRTEIISKDALFRMCIVVAIAVACCERDSTRITVHDRSFCAVWHHSKRQRELCESECQQQSTAGLYQVDAHARTPTCSTTTHFHRS